MADGIEVAALPQCFRAHVTSARGHENRVAEQGVQGFSLAAAHEANTVAHLMHRDRRPLTVEILQFLHERRRHLDLGALAQDLKLLAAADELASEILPEHLQKFIPVPQERICFFMIAKNDLSFQCLLQRIDSPASFSDCFNPVHFFYGCPKTPRRDSFIIT